MQSKEELLKEQASHLNMIKITVGVFFILLAVVWGLDKNTLNLMPNLYRAILGILVASGLCFAPIFALLYGVQWKVGHTLLQNLEAVDLSQNMPSSHLLSQRLRQLRQERAMTQEHLADLSGVHVRTIRRLETDGKSSSETLRAIAAAFQLPVEHLLQKTQDTRKADFVRWKEEEALYFKNVKTTRRFNIGFMAYLAPAVGTLGVLLSVVWTQLLKNDVFPLWLLLGMPYVFLCPFALQHLNAEKGQARYRLHQQRVFAFYAGYLLILAGNCWAALGSLAFTYSVLGLSLVVIAAWFAWILYTIHDTPKEWIERRHTAQQHLLLAMSLLKAPQMDPYGTAQQITFAVESLSLSDASAIDCVRYLLMVKSGILTQMLTVAEAETLLQTIDSVLAQTQTFSSVSAFLQQYFVHVQNALLPPPPPSLEKRPKKFLLQHA